MTLVELLVLLLIAGICGALGKAIVGYMPGGFFVSIGVGFVGALIGSWIAHAVGMHELLAVQIGGTTFPIVWSILGSVVFVALLAVIGRGFAPRAWT